MKNLDINVIFKGKTQKEREDILDCQDDFQVKGNCFSIADGAGQSLYPDSWANLLVNHYCDSPEISVQNWEEWLLPIQDKWVIDSKNRVEISKQQNKPSWISNFNRLNQLLPATSTFIGLTIENIDDNSLKVKYTIVGDSCLFIIDKKSINSYLINDPNQFNDRPDYFASYKKDNIFKPTIIEKIYNIEIPTYFLLCTDALSEYVMKRKLQKGFIADLLSIRTIEDFLLFVENGRHSNDPKLKSDDVTLIIIEVKVKESNKSDVIPTVNTVEESIDKEPILEGEPLNKSGENGDNNNLLGSDILVKSQDIKTLTEEIKTLIRTRKLLYISNVITFSLLIIFFIKYYLINNKLKNQQVNDPTEKSTSFRKEESKPESQSKDTLQLQKVKGASPLYDSLNNQAKNDNSKQIVDVQEKILKKGIIIYAINDTAKQQLKTTLQFDLKVKVINTNSFGFIFESELFINKNNATIIDNDISIKPGNNMRDKNGNLIGQVINETRFKKLIIEKDKFSFLFKGYVRNQDLK